MEIVTSLFLLRDFVEGRQFADSAPRNCVPAWMLAKGWHPVEWRVTREQWESGRPGRRYTRSA